MYAKEPQRDMNVHMKRTTTNIPILSYLTFAIVVGLERLCDTNGLMSGDYKQLESV